MPGRWQPTRNRRLVQRIAKKVSEPDQLTVWDGACMRFSSNLNDRGISNGRLCFVGDASHCADPQSPYIAVRVAPLDVDIGQLQAATSAVIQQWPLIRVTASTRLRTFSIRE
ncbi:unnamed protein product [Vitrella brassicaformis CCMP3155]|uniref:Uncharacterized protein n=1 Tax=Vitrella brassicaformis (strain CCMP3155) TaxID=1169540 RepID=A0A0G4G0E9_VITBC|nr:unnamed protein product [Vitrella brassicaformis CCMP3155]|eukprot:CEM21337.1 unnamed protein product [Vitrella brassicaformis CCMP3155]